MLCREQATRLRRHHQEFVNAGVGLVVIGQGDATAVTAFQRALDLPYPVYGDPGRAAYRAFGLSEGTVRQLTSVATLAGYARAVLSGAGVSKPSGNGRQLPGAFVIDRDGVVRYSHPATHGADIPSPERLVAAALS
ncbi:MAG: AhpC/TSA family protein [Chloroflexota bacterium]|nr:AhpC/TSA family protein [Chloroflexota bacterium]